MEVRRLRFADPAIEAEFRANADRRALPPVRRVVALTALAYAASALVDGLSRPEARPFISAFRFGVVGPLAIAVVILSRRRGAERWLQPAACLFGVVSAGGLVAMTLWTHPILKTRDFALLLALLLVLARMLKLRFPAALVLTAATTATYWVGVMVAGGERPIDLMVFAVAATFGLVEVYSAEVAQRTDFLQRRLIQAQSRSLREALQEVEARRWEAEDAANHDPLTELANRRQFFALASGSRPTTMAVILLDLDHFKAVNDTHGHAVGDCVLQAVAEILRENVRPGDTPCRFGGEEFAVLLPRTDLRGAAAVGERLRSRIGAASIPTGQGPLTVSVSVGIAAADGEPAAVEALLDRADQALYQAKNAGRDRVRLWKPPDDPTALPA